MSVSPQKYLFATSFEAEDIEYRDSFHSPEAFEKARQISFQEGYDACHKSLEAANQEHLLRIGEQFMQLICRQEELQARAGTLISQVLMAALKQAFPVFAKQAQDHEIWGVVTQALEQDPIPSSMTVYVAPEAAQSLRDKLISFFEGKNKNYPCQVMEKEGMQSTDCQIVWESGGLERLSQRVLEALEVSLLRFGGSDPVDFPCSQNALSQDQKKTEATIIEETENGR